MSTFSEVLKDVRKKHGLHVGPLNEIFAEVPPSMTTGNIAIDDCMGGAGIPLGRSVEFFGVPSSGKTTVSLQAAAHLQREIIASGEDKYILYEDFEQALDLDYAKALGLDPDHRSFLFCQPENLEQGANVALELIQTGQVQLSIWDSVAAMTPSEMLEAEVGKHTVALQARLMSDFMRKMNPRLMANRSSAIFLNHSREVLELRRPGAPPRTTTPGGAALKFYASVRVDFQQIKNIKAKTTDILTGEEGETVEATNVRVKVVKNKMAPPFRQCVVRVRSSRGFDNFWSALQILVGYKKVPNSAGFYYFDKMPELVVDDMPRQSTGSKRPYVRGEQSILQFADEHPEWRDLVISAAKKVLEEARAAHAVPVLNDVSQADVGPADAGSDGDAGEEFEALSSGKAKAAPARGSAPVLVDASELLGD